MNEAEKKQKKKLKRNKKRKEANRKAGSLGFYAGTFKTNESQPKKKTKSKNIKES